MNLHIIKIRGWKNAIYGEVMFKGETWLYIRQVVDWSRYDGYMLIRCDYIEEIQMNEKTAFYMELLHKRYQLSTLAPDIDTENSCLVYKAMAKSSRVCIFSNVNEAVVRVGEVLYVEEDAITIRPLSPKAIWGREEQIQISEIIAIAWDTNYSNALSAHNRNPLKPSRQYNGVRLHHLYRFKIRGWRKPLLGILDNLGNAWCELRLLDDDYLIDGTVFLNCRYLSYIENDAAILFKEAVLRAKGERLKNAKVAPTKALESECSLIPWLGKQSRLYEYYKQKYDKFHIGRIEKILPASFYCRCVDDLGREDERSYLFFCNQMRLIGYNGSYVELFNMLD